MTPAEPQSKKSWRKSVNSRSFPRELRSIRYTLITLADRMSPEGVLAAWIDQIEAHSGLPRRTVERHLARAVEAGWLIHIVRGGNSRKGVYQASFPTTASPPSLADYSGLLDAPTAATSGPKGADDSLELSAIRYGQPVTSSPPHSGGVNRDSASGSEHLALERMPASQLHPTVSDSTNYKKQKRSEEESEGASVAAAVSPIAPRSRITLALGCALNAGTPSAPPKCFVCHDPLTSTTDRQRGMCGACT
jgi:hypothetical protein